MFGIGMALLSVGIMTADSESILLPALIALVGALLAMKGAKE